MYIGMGRVGERNKGVGRGRGRLLLPCFPWQLSSFLFAWGLRFYTAGGFKSACEAWIFGMIFRKARVMRKCYFCSQHVIIRGFSYMHFNYILTNALCNVCMYTLMIIYQVTRKISKIF